MAFLACARNLAQRFLAAFEIFALAAADMTRFFVRVKSRLADLPRACAADCKPLKSSCNLANCFFTFFSSLLIALSMLMNPPETIYPRTCHTPIRFLRSALLNWTAGYRPQ